TTYRELGSTYFEQHRFEQHKRRCLDQLQNLGFQATLTQMAKAACGAITSIRRHFHNRGPGLAEPKSRQLSAVRARLPRRAEGGKRHPRTPLDRNARIADRGVGSPS